MFSINVTKFWFLLILVIFLRIQSIPLVLFTCCATCWLYDNKSEIDKNLCSLGVFFIGFLFPDEYLKQYIKWKMYFPFYYSSYSCIFQRDILNIYTLYPNTIYLSINIIRKRSSSKSKFYCNKRHHGSIHWLCRLIFSLKYKKILQNKNCL